MASFTELPDLARDSLTVRRVFGDPIERDGITFIPVAAVMGGGGGGEGGDDEGQQGSGGGFGVHARPVGAYVIRGAEVQWVPSFDPMRAIVAGVVVFGMMSVLALAGMRHQRKAWRASL